jgi:hypothetical protein
VRKVSYAVFLLVIGFAIGRGSSIFEDMWFFSAVTDRSVHQGGLVIPESETSIAVRATGDGSLSRSGESHGDMMSEFAERWAGYDRDNIVDSLTAWSGAPSEVVDVIIESMSERELRSAITSLTGLTDDDLAEVGDLRAFTRRAAEVAMDNVVSFKDSLPEALPPVEFSHNPNDMEEFTTDRFVGDERIFAVFPSTPSAHDEVFVKWYRSGEPEILMFDRYPIQQETDRNFVWIDNSEGWPAGEYAVEIYSADEAMSPLASGRYVVDPSLAGPFGKIPPTE